MLSINRTTSAPSSRKNSAIVTPVSPTRWRTPGGSFIWPKTSANFSSTVDSRIPMQAASHAQAGEPGGAAVLLGDVADQLLDDDGLAAPCAAEDANLAAFAERGDQ